MTSEKDERISGALQENILTVLCFDEKYCKLVRAAITPHIFETAAIREVAGHAIDYIDQFKKPIGEHLADELEPILVGSDVRKAKLYKGLIDNLFLASTSVNGEYVVSQLQKFVRAQNMKSAVIKASEALIDGRVDDAEVALQKALSSQIVTFSPGLSFGDPSQSLGFLESVEPPLLSGIEALDRYGVGPSRKTSFLVIAPTSRGKTWWLMHLGKWAILQRQSVLHMSLEMSEEKCAMRFHQTMFSITKHARPVRAPRFVLDRSGLIVDIDYEEILRPSLADDNIDSLLRSKLHREWRRRPRLIIKSFPTGQLTVPMFEAYLDNLERFEKFVPDVISLDYPDLFKLDPKNARAELGEISKGIRGVAVERNLCMISASQTNREGIDAKQVRETNLSEDISKAFTADVICTYNQTDLEHRLGLARIYVPKNRDDEGRMWAMITQSYAMGQFCLDSRPLAQDYWDLMHDAGQRAPTDD